MAVKYNKGVAVAIQHVPEESEGDTLRIGTDLWDVLLSPTSGSVHDGPITVSVGLLQSHTGFGSHVASSVRSVVCWAVRNSKDVRVSNRLW
jgi:hypothetical protein